VIGTEKERDIETGVGAGIGNLGIGMRIGIEVTDIEAGLDPVPDHQVENIEDLTTDIDQLHTLVPDPVPAIGRETVTEIEIGIVTDEGDPLQLNYTDIEEGLDHISVVGVHLQLIITIRALEVL